MQYTLNPQINLWIDQIHEHILKLYPQVVMKEQPGFRSINYGLLPGMKAVRCYIICYDQKANLGLPHEVDLIDTFPYLRGTGKTHRHVEINQKLMDNQKVLIKLLTFAFKN
ncbi:MAG: hypothetical protein ACO3H6_03805 [Bacilli bacterium]